MVEEETKKNSSAGGSSSPSYPVADKTKNPFTNHNNQLLGKRKLLLFSVTRRSRSDVSQSATLKTDLADVTVMMAIMMMTARSKQ